MYIIYRQHHFEGHVNFFRQQYFDDANKDFWSHLKISSLWIPEARAIHSGNYTCSPQVLSTRSFLWKLKKYLLWDIASNSFLAFGVHVNLVTRPPCLLLECTAIGNKVKVTIFNYQWCFNPNAVAAVKSTHSDSNKSFWSNCANNAIKCKWSLQWSLFIMSELMLLPFFAVCGPWFSPCPRHSK